MKRTYQWADYTGRRKRRFNMATGVVPVRIPVRPTPLSWKQPRRSYRNSLVPLRSGGYTPNTVERKVYDGPTDNIMVNTSGEFTLLCVPQLGSDMNNRIGRKLTVKSIYIKGRVQTSASITPAGNARIPAQQARMIILIDFQPNGAEPLVSDLLTAATPQAQLNINNRDRFRILTDKEYVFDPYISNTTADTAVASADNQIKLVKKYKVLNQEVIFNTSTGTVADITSGAIYMFWIGSQPNSGNVDAQFIGTTRVRYIDA